VGPKIYTVREANRLIGSIEEVFEDLDKVRTRLKFLKNKLEVLEMLWGEEIQSEENPDHKEFLHYMAEVEKAKQDFESTNKRLADMEVMLKSVDAGLVDFYGVVEGRLVFLCWKRGERSVDQYHHIDEGFAGRMPIPAEELTR